MRQKHPALLMMLKLEMNILQKHGYETMQFYSLAHRIEAYKRRQYKRDGIVKQALAYAGLWTSVGF